MVLIVVLFIIVFVTVLACVGLGLSFLKTQQKNQIRSMLRKAEATPAEQRSGLLLKPADNHDALTKLLRRFRFMDRLDLILEQAGDKGSPTKLLLFSGFACVVGFVVGTKLRLLGTEWTAVALAALSACVPLMLVLRKRAKAIASFEKQFPEALDFLSRSMRAGHGFSIALEMLAADSPDPLGSAFRRISNDLQLGSSLDTALGKLNTLVPLVDVRFFVSSVMLQQETGGNLGEVLSKLALIIRERFRLKGQVKAASAHGRITGLVLVLMPVGVVCMLMMSNPKYLVDMANDPTGKLMIYGAAAGQIVGYFVIKKITNIKV